jgi:hypothetical protein
MKILDKILEFKRTPYVIAGVIFLSSLVVLSCFKSAETQLTTLNHAASLTRTMAKSSDDLTNYARFFVTTKNEQWRTEFNHVLKIRNGEVADEKGITKSFKDRVKEVPFSQVELDKLLKAEQLSNNLAKLEVEAFAWIDKGRPEINFDIMMHHYTEAQMLMFGDDYKKYKQEIVVTTDEFYVMVVNRLQSEYLFYMTAAWTLIIVINVSLLLLIMVIKHKEVIDSKPVRKIARKMPIKKPVTKKVTKEIKQL